jgi:N-acetylneuraminate synthase
VITLEMLDFKRPGTGISPAEVDWVVGRVAKEDIAADSIIERGFLI